MASRGASAPGSAKGRNALAGFPEALAGFPVALARRDPRICGRRWEPNSTIQRWQLKARNWRAGAISRHHMLGRASFRGWGSRDLLHACLGWGGNMIPLTVPAI